MRGQVGQRKNVGPALDDRGTKVVASHGSRIDRNTENQIVVGLAGQQNARHVQEEGVAAGTQSVGRRAKESDLDVVEVQIGGGAFVEQRAKEGNAIAPNARLRGWVEGEQQARLRLRQPRSQGEAEQANR